MVSPEQENAFYTAMNGVSMSEMGLLIASLVIMLFFIWSAWNLWWQGRAWLSNIFDLHQLMWSVMRIALIAIVVAYCVRPG